MLVPTDEEEAGTGQLVGLVQVAEPWPAAAADAHSSVHLSFLVIPSYYLHPVPNHRVAAAAGIETGEAGFLLV